MQRFSLGKPQESIYFLNLPSSPMSKLVQETIWIIKCTIQKVPQKMTKKENLQNAEEIELN